MPRATTTDAAVPWNGDSAIARDLPPHLRDFAWLLSQTVETFGAGCPDIQRLWSLYRFICPNPQQGAALSPEESTWVSTLPPGWRAQISKRGNVEYVQTSGLKGEATEQVSAARPEQASADAADAGPDLVGIVGTKGVGKDTAGRYLVEVCGWHRVALATPLRDAVQSMFALTDAQCDVPGLKEEPGGLGVSFRRGAQVLGTDVVRKQLGGGAGLLPELGEKGLWIQHMERAVADARCKGRRVVVTDVRFPDEAAAIVALGGKLIHITRPGALGNRARDPHASEHQVPHIAARLPLLHVVNDGSLDDLGRKVVAAVQR